MEPASAEVHRCLGEFLYEDKKDLDGAITAFREAVRLRPGYAAAHCMLGVALGRKRKQGEAEAELREAVRLRPADPEFRSCLGAFLCDEKREYDAAISEFQEALRLKPGFVKARFNLAVALGNKGRLDEAVGELREVVRLDARDAGAHALLGHDYARSGRWDEATAAVDRARELRPGAQWNQHAGATLHLHAGDVEGYRRACRELLRRFGRTEDPETAATVARACSLAPGAVADLAPVRQLADRAATGTEKHSRYRNFVLARALADCRTGRPAAAVDGLKGVSPKADGGVIDALMFATLALANHGLGQADEARAALDKARAILASKMPNPDAGRPFGDDWLAWLHCQVLCREAEALLKPARTGQPMGKPQVSPRPE
jgi:tetratricopeptide (TPR) repeat protein